MNGLRFLRYYLLPAMSVCFPNFMTDLGSRQGGIGQAVMQAIAASPEELRSLLLANIILVGGNCKLPGFLERLFCHLICR